MHTDELHHSFVLFLVRNGTHLRCFEARVTDHVAGANLLESTCEVVDELVGDAFLNEDPGSHLGVAIVSADLLIATNAGLTAQI